MPLVVHSPYSGKPVKVRDEDIHRAIRDEEGRIFYVVQRTTAEGYYASPTRQGSEKDEQRYLDMLEKSTAVEQHKRAATATPVHDATGQGRARSVGMIVRLVIVLILLLAIAYIILGYTGNLPGTIPNILPGGGTEPQQPIDGLGLDGRGDPLADGVAGHSEIILETAWVAPALPGTGEQLIAAHVGRGQIGTAHEMLIDGAGGAAALGDGPDDQRRAAAHVAAGEDLLEVGGEPAVGRRDGPARFAHAELLHEPGRVVTGEADGQQHQLSRQVALGAGHFVGDHFALGIAGPVQQRDAHRLHAA